MIRLISGIRIDRTTGDNYPEQDISNRQGDIQ